MSVRLRIAVAASILAGAAARADQPYFIGLGDLPGGRFASGAVDVSADGSVVVGSSNSRGGFANDAFIWTAATGMIPLDPKHENIVSKAHAVLADGSTVVGIRNLGLGDPNSNPNAGPEAFRWTREEGMVGLGDLPNNRFWSSGIGVSRDGKMIVGFGSSGRAEDVEAMRWTPDGGMVGLGDFPGYDFVSVALDITPDGSVVVGFGHSRNGNEAFRWTAGGLMEGIGDLPGLDFDSSAFAVSTDGRVIVGYGRSENGTEAFRWTARTGMVGLGDMPGGNFQSFSDGVSGKGGVVVGQGWSERGQEAFIWDQRHGIRALRDVLIDDYGLDVARWRLVDANAMSDDGRTIVGGGWNPNGDAEAWLAFLGSDPCPADLNGDFEVNLADLRKLLRNFGTRSIGLPSMGDANHDGDIDLADLSMLLSAFGTSCP